VIIGLFYSQETLPQWPIISRFCLVEVDLMLNVLLIDIGMYHLKIEKLEERKLPDPDGS
jgi:hypothetical protein